MSRLHKSEALALVLGILHFTGGVVSFACVHEDTCTGFSVHGVSELMAGEQWLS